MLTALTAVSLTAVVATAVLGAHVCTQLFTANQAQHQPTKKHIHFYTFGGI